MLDHQTLEQLFVCRSHLVDDCIERIQRASITNERASRLFVGPRGAGKSHLLSLVAHRAMELEGFGKTFFVSWLPEDLWTIDSFADLVSEISSSLLPAADLDGTLEQLRIAVNGVPIVVVIENLDQVLAHIGITGQRELRALIENEGLFVILGSSTRLSRELTHQTEPFYGFFDLCELEAFGVDDAAMMLTRLAELHGDHELVTFLESTKAHSRLAAIAHLAGGQPRVWALLSTGLTVQRLDDLVDLLLEAFDDLTPYYQEQMARLSASERKVVRALAKRDRYSTVKDLAQELKVPQRSVSKTISDLRVRGWIRQLTGPIAEVADGRLSYYELAEPLARLAFQLKESRGEPIPLLVDFVKLWFDRAEDGRIDEELIGSLTQAIGYEQRASASFVADLALQASRLIEDGTTSRAITPERTRLSEELLRLDDALRQFGGGDPSPLLELPTSLIAAVESKLKAGIAVDLELACIDFAIGDAETWQARVQPLNTSADRNAALLAHGLTLGYLQLLTDETSVQRVALGSADKLSLSEPLSISIALLADRKVQCSWVDVELYTESLLFGLVFPQLHLRPSTAVVLLAFVLRAQGLSGVELEAIHRLVDVESVPDVDRVALATHIQSNLEPDDAAKEPLLRLVNRLSESGPR
jgi:DNA-binding MarR family transcriptional regulator